jgi:hypothetical protein
LYRAFLVDKESVAEDVHFEQGCSFCHMGDVTAQTKEEAHQKVVKRPSADLSLCAQCHDDIAENYKGSLHNTTEGLRHGISGRLSKDEMKVFDGKVFEQSCRTCHASCGSCHVKSPVIGGVNLGLIKGHKFVRKAEDKTCALCHGGRVYPEFTGEYGGVADVHYQKNMSCLDCHKKEGFHGDGQKYSSRKQVKERPSCVQCHKPGEEKSVKAKQAHLDHNGKVSCTACHSAAPYRNCSECHIGKGATSKPGFHLGLSPRDKTTVTTLRLVPTVRETFETAGIKMERYDSMPNYWDTMPHNIRKRTDRTRSCDVCHIEKRNFLTMDELIHNGSKANQTLLYEPKPLKK